MIKDEHFTDWFHLNIHQVKSLEHVGHLSQLVSLNVSRNRLQRDALLKLHQVTHLKVLHISHVEGITGDEALTCLQGKNKILSFLSLF